MNIVKAVSTAERTMKDSAKALLAALDNKDNKAASEALRKGTASAFLMDKAKNITEVHLTAGEARDKALETLRRQVAEDKDSKVIAQTFNVYKTNKRKASALAKVEAAWARIA